MHGPDANSPRMPGIATVLVPLDSFGRAGAGLRLAADAARRQGASLVAVHVEAWPAGAASDGRPQAEIPAGTAPDAETPVRDMAGAMGVPLRCETVAGDRACVTHALVDLANTADLIVIDRWAPRSPADGWIMSLFEELPLLAGRPTVFVPNNARGGGFGERVMVAWNASRESSRAVSDALPILELANDVMVLNIETPDDRRPSEDGAEARLASYLSRHGIRVTLCKSYIAGADVGETIASRACDSRADLLIMGAYGHRRAGQVWLGPATRYLLDNMPVPILMSH